MYHNWADLYLQPSSLQVVSMKKIAALEEKLREGRTNGELGLEPLQSPLSNNTIQTRARVGTILTITHVELEHFICWPWGSGLWYAPHKVSSALDDGEGVPGALRWHLRTKRVDILENMRRIIYTPNNVYGQKRETW